MYNQIMREKILKGEVTSWCGTKIFIEVRESNQGELYFQKLDTELPKKKIFLVRVRDACNRMIEEIEKTDKK